MAIVTQNKPITKSQFAEQTSPSFPLFQEGAIMRAVSVYCVY